MWLSKAFFLREFVCQTIVCVLVCVVVLSFESLAYAQSGRKIKTTKTGNPSTTETTQQSEKPQTENQASESEEKKTPFLVTSYPVPPNVFVLTKWVVRECENRLAGSPVVVVSDGGELQRAEAIKKAQDFTQKTYVVWLKMDIDTMDQRSADTENSKVTTGPITPSQLMVEYTVFVSKTGKAVSQGHIYFHPPGKKTRDVVIGGPSSSPDTIRDLMKRAGRETADRILSDLNLPLPKDK